MDCEYLIIWIAWSLVTNRIYFSTGSHEPLGKSVPPIGKKLGCFVLILLARLRRVQCSNLFWLVRPVLIE